MNELQVIGRRIGGVQFAQGAGGNASCKTSDTLLVKASGRRLRDLGAPGSIAEVPLTLARQALAGDADAERQVFSATPRPSLETYFHAIGGRVVLHTHALGALLTACSTSGRADVQMVPYERPGVGLARAVHEALGTRQEGTFVLQSHGLLVYAASVEAAIERTMSTDLDCRRPFGDLPDFAASVAALDAPTPLASGGCYSTLPRRRIDCGRYLFPDAVVYATVLHVPTLDDDLTALATHALSTLGRPVVLVGDDGRRVHCARTVDELEQAREVALAHDWVEDVLGPRGETRYLPEDEPAKIVAMPSERYRLELTRKNTSC